MFLGYQSSSLYTVFVVCAECINTSVGYTLIQYELILIKIMQLLVVAPHTKMLNSN